MVKRLNQMFPDTYRHHIPTRFSETNKCPIRNKVTNPHCLDHQEEYLSLAVLHLERNNCYMRNFPIFFQSFFSLYKVPLRLFLLAWQVSHERPCLPDPPTTISVPPQDNNKNVENAGQEYRKHKQKSVQFQKPDICNREHTTDKHLPAR